MATPYLQVSRDASRALEEFSDEFKSALVLGDFESWAGMFGLMRTSSAIKTTWPIPISAAGYHEFKGDHKYRALYHRSLSMTTKQWQDGVEEQARIIEAPDFIDWAGEPGRIATEWLRQPQNLVADMLAISSLDGPLLDFYRDADSDTASTRRLFAADHPYNVLNTGLGDFDNRLETTEAEIASGAFFDAANAHFRSIKGANGKPLGLRMRGGSCLVPSELENLFKNTLQFDSIIQAVNAAGATGATSGNVAAVTRNNIYKGTVGYNVADELADQTHFYVLAAGRPGLYPWIVQQGGQPEEFLFDKSSERYKNTLKVAVSYVGDMAVAACLPHGIARVTVTG